MSDMRRLVLVAGGAGYIGSVLCRRLLACGHIGVRCLDSLMYGNGHAVVPFLRHDGYEFVRGDHANVGRALADVTDVVMLSGLVGEPVTTRNPDAAKRINETGVRAFFDACEEYEVERLVFASTCSNYGIADGLATEDTPLRPLSAYARAKVDAERYLLGQYREYVPTVLRFATAFGLSPRMRFDLTLNQFARAAVLGRELDVYGGDTWRPYCHTEDIARAIELTLSLPDDAVCGRTFNVGGENLKKWDLVNLSGLEVADYLPAKDERSYRVDFSRFRDISGFRPRFSVDDGIAEVKRAVADGLFDGGRYSFPYLNEL